MRRTHLETLAEFDSYVAENGSLDECIVQGLDLRQRTSRLLDVSVEQTVFLGCKVHETATYRLLTGGAVLFPDLGEGRPYHPTRSGLYDLDELMAGFEADQPGSFEASVDVAIYRHFQRYRHAVLPPLLEELAQRIHDHAIDDALAELLAEPDHGKVVGVMGGHAMRRGTPEFERVARIAWELGRLGYFVATGGGPGAMEAANLGAWMSSYSFSKLEEALQLLAPEPDYRTHEYLLAGYRVRHSFPEGASSLAVPTWFYGHEPSNQFARHIAKYFSNSLREDGLLAIARHGVIYAPGSAGTVQEVFMDAAQNHYGTFEVVSPMVFLGTQEWTERRPVMPLLKSLAGQRQYASRIAVLDDVDAVVQFVRAHPPVPYEWR